VSRAAIALKRPVEAGPVLAYLQECRRAHRNKSRWDRFTDAYTVSLFAALGGYLAFAALRESPISRAEAVPVIDELAGWAPPVLLLLLVASLRHCTWQGPVLFSLPDVEWLLSAPLSHVEIVRRRLRRGLAIAAGLGAALGLATFVPSPHPMCFRPWGPGPPSTPQCRETRLDPTTLRSGAAPPAREAAR
jgi:hypothetical protein